MVKISAQILGQVIGNSETDTLSASEKTALSPSPEQHWRQDAAWVSANPSAFLEWEVQVQNKALTSEPYWLPAHTPPRMAGSDLDNTIARKSHATQGKREGFMKNPKFIANYILLPFVLHFYRIYWYPWFFHRCTCWLWRVSVQFQFHPQFLVLFCRTNTLDREKKQEGQGLMVHSSAYL